MRVLRRLGRLSAGLLVALFVSAPLLAGASSANISKSYQAAEAIANGSIVSLDFKRSDYVAPANTVNAARLIGVVLPSNDSLLAVNPTDSGVQVATSGSVNAVVSTLNGDIRVGDSVAVSPFNGVGMKAGDGDRVIGLAQTDFNRGTNGARLQTIQDKNGKPTEVAVGYLRLNIAIGTNNPSQSSIQRLGRSITGRSMPAYRLIISGIIALLALTAVVTLIYAAIYGSIISVGRNPLAKYAIFRATSSVIAMAILTALMAGIAIYFLLR